MDRHYLSGSAKRKKKDEKKARAATAIQNVPSITSFFKKDQQQVATSNDVTDDANVSNVAASPTDASCKVVASSPTNVSANQQYVQESAHFPKWQE